MLVIEAEFRSFDELTIAEVSDAVGVYVLWGPRNLVRPSYIGEGTILKRYLEHLKWIKRPFTGVTAILGNEKEKGMKWRAQVLESMLLFISKEIGRPPVKNRSKGSLSGYEKIFKKEKKIQEQVRFRISGRDPLKHPRTPLMKRTKVINFRACPDEEAWNTIGSVPWRKK